MFWGLIMDPGYCYNLTLRAVSLHVSMAALESNSSKVSDSSVTEVICIFERRKYLLCTLNKKKDKLQCALDLNFETGSNVSFATTGKSRVHLTGYLTDEMEDGANKEKEVEEKETVKNYNNKRLKKMTGGPPKKKLSRSISNYTSDEGEKGEDSLSNIDLEKMIKKCSIPLPKQKEERQEEPKSPNTEGKEDQKLTEAKKLTLKGGVVAQDLKKGEK